MKKITCKIAGDYLGVSPMAVSIGMRNDLLPIGFTIHNEDRYTDKVAQTPTKEENMQLLRYEEERKRHSWASKPQIRKYDYVYNEKLTLIVDTQKSFRDCKSYVVEERLGDIMIQIYERRLSQARIFQQVNSTSRNRIFAYSDYLDILRGGTQQPNMDVNHKS